MTWMTNDMNEKMNKKQITLTIFSFILLLFLSSWGYQGHQKISGGIVLHLPQEMAFLVPAWTDVVRLHASDADYRKATDPNEGTRHYIEIDNYPEFIFSGTINQDLDSLVAEFGYSFVIDQGVLPWATITAYDSLVSCFQRKEWHNAGLFAADLGHYVGDGHMPLHITKNYNGQYSGNTGIHSRFESKMINRYGSRILLSQDSAIYIEDVSGFVFGYIYMNYPYVDSILHADDQARQIAGSTSSDLYYQSLWNVSDSFTINLFQRGSTALTALIRTAWIEAGKPVMDPNALPEPESKHTTQLFQNFPNPFRSETYVPIEVADPNTMVTIQVCNTSGVVVATILEEKVAQGYHEIPWDSEGVGEGIYYCILKTDDAVMIRKMVVVR